MPLTPEEQRWVYEDIGKGRYLWTAAMQQIAADHIREVVRRIQEGADTPRRDREPPQVLEARRLKENTGPVFPTEEGRRRAAPFIASTNFRRQQRARAAAARFNQDLAKVTNEKKV